MLKAAIKTFFKSEISIGITLILVTIVSLLFVNSDNHQIYEDFFSMNIPLNMSFVHIYKDLTLREWINDALMAVFFLLVGLELKREVLVGELSSKKKFSLPAIAAIGGVVFPALIFIYFNIGNEENLNGFAVPTATDIAFAYGMISLFGKKIPNALKVFLVALAVLDDLVAILIIAFFYTQNFSPVYLVYAGFVIIGLIFLNLKNSNRLSLYMILGAVLWLMILKSGIHATLAGVVTAIFIPLNVKNEHTLSNL
ncbi:MAG: Na+/H+ antiporter NhaA, partial [Rickettsiales bacterium]|nr:Na+/H+ antiporter NhaA [Rickettsiales bacterium]